MKDFFAFYQQEILKKDTIIVYEPAQEVIPYTEEWQAIQIDSLKEKEFTLLAQEKWTSNDFANAKMMSKDEDHKMYYNRDISRKFFMKNGRLYYFSQPYISKDNTYILIGIGVICELRCGNYKVQLFKKQEHKWILIKTYSEEVS